MVVWGSRYIFIFKDGITLLNQRPEQTFVHFFGAKQSKQVVSIEDDNRSIDVKSQVIQKYLP